MCVQCKCIFCWFTEFAAICSQTIPKPWEECNGFYAATVCFWKCLHCVDVLQQNSRLRWEYLLQTVRHGSYSMTLFTLLALLTSVSDWRILEAAAAALKLKVIAVCLCVCTRLGTLCESQSCQVHLGRQIHQWRCTQEWRHCQSLPEGQVLQLKGDLAHSDLRAHTCTCWLESCFLFNDIMLFLLWELVWDHTRVTPK